MREHPCGAHEIVRLPFPGKGDHLVKELPDPKGKKSPMNCLDGLSAEGVGNTVIELVPLVRIDEVVLLCQIEKRLAIWVLLVHISKMIRPLHLPCVALLPDPRFPEEIGDIRHRHELVASHAAEVSLENCGIVVADNLGIVLHQSNELLKVIGESDLGTRRNREVPDGPPSVGLIDIPSADG